jgi:ERCC4-type nuclease
MSVIAVQVDQREPRHLQRLAFGGVPVDVGLLPTGDYLLVADDGTLIGVERKTVSDFLNTLGADRLFAQLSRLKALTEYAYLALVGDMRPARDGGCYVDGLHRDWQWASVQGALLSVQEIGVHVLWVPDDDELEASLIRLANRQRGPLRVKPIRETVVISEQEAILAAFPGIGSDRAAAIMAECGHDLYLAIAFLNTPSKFWEGLEVAGIGEGIKKRFRKALNLPDDLALAIMPLPAKEEN